MKNCIAEVWEEYYLHDAPFLGMEMDFERAEISLHFELWDRLLEEEKKITFIFSGFFKFTSEYPPEMDFKPDGCYGWQWKEVEPGKFEADFTFTIDDWDVWKLSVGFTSLRTEGGLSEEARAARAAYFEEQTEG